MQETQVVRRPAKAPNWKRKPRIICFGFAFSQETEHMVLPPPPRPARRGHTEAISRESKWELQQIKPLRCNSKHSPSVRLDQEDTTHRPSAAGTPSPPRPLQATLPGATLSETWRDELLPHPAWPAGGPHVLSHHAPGTSGHASLR